MLISSTEQRCGSESSIELVYSPYPELFIRSRENFFCASVEYSLYATFICCYSGSLILTEIKILKVKKNDIVLKSYMIEIRVKHIFFLSGTIL